MAQKPHVVIEEDLHKVVVKEYKDKGTPIFVQMRTYLEESPTFKTIRSNQKGGRK